MSIPDWSVERLHTLMWRACIGVVDSERKRFFLKKEAKTFAHSGTRWGSRVPECAADRERIS
jgi:hypothetical protein